MVQEEWKWNFECPLNLLFVGDTYCSPLYLIVHTKSCSQTQCQWSRECNSPTRNVLSGKNSRYSKYISLWHYVNVQGIIYKCAPKPIPDHWGCLVKTSRMNYWKNMTWHGSLRYPDLFVFGFTFVNWLSLSNKCQDLQLSILQNQSLILQFFQESGIHIQWTFLLCVSTGVRK